MQPAIYEIDVDGVLPAAEWSEFVGMEIAVTASQTTLRGVVRDQPALVGVVARIESLGCSVRECRVLETWFDFGSGKVS